MFTAGHPSCKELRGRGGLPCDALSQSYLSRHPGVPCPALGVFHELIPSLLNDDPTRARRFNDMNRGPILGGANHCHVTDASVFRHEQYITYLQI